MKYSFLEKLAGDFRKSPDEVKLNWEAEELIEKAFDDIPEEKFIDCHTHIMGIGSGGTGCWANPEFFSWLHPAERLKMMAFMNSSGVENPRHADQEYLQRFVKLVEDFPYRGKFMLLALDKTYDKEGNVNENDTKFHVPNEYMYDIYLSNREWCIPCVSIHPYRKDAVNELEKWARRGVKAVKWLPNEMGMKPSDPVCEPFYEKMREYDMVLLGHAGKESAIEVFKFKPLGNPLFYRKPLDMGVKVIMAHCASLGIGIDEDSPLKKPVRNYTLFLRLMEEKRYEGLLFADISAIIQVNRMGMPLRDIIKRQDLHHRLINGSDYPLPAMNASISTTALSSLGYITSREAQALHQIYKRNPLLFDFVLKRCLQDPLDKKNKFSPTIFQENPLLDLSPSVEAEMRDVG